MVANDVRTRIKNISIKLRNIVSSAFVLSLLIASMNGAVAHAATPGTVGSWTSSPNTLPQALETHDAAVYNGYVYVIGGAGSGGAQDTVYYSHLNSDGSVGSWVTSPHTIPQGLEGPTVEVNNGYIYVLGGFTSGFTRSTTVYYAPLANDGSVGSWTTNSNALPQGLDLGVSVVLNNFIYYMGGFGNGGQKNVVYYAPLNNDGSVGTWVSSPHTLPQAVYSPTAEVNNGYVYVMGGTTSGGQISSVYYAPIANDGSVGAWVTSTSLPVTLDAAATIVYNNFVYVIGGYNGSNTVQTVYYAPLNSDGSVGTWITSGSSLPLVRQFQPAVFYNGFVYVLGGSDGVADTQTVYYAAITGPAQASTSTTASTVGAPNTGYGNASGSGSRLAYLLILGALLCTAFGRRKLRQAHTKNQQ